MSIGSSSDGLRVGTPAPDLSGTTLANTRPRRRRWAILFVAASCPDSRVLARELGTRAVRELPTPLFVAARSEAAFDRLGVPGPFRLLQTRGELSRAFHTWATPTVFVIGDDGRIADRGRPRSFAELEALLDAPPTKD